MAIAESAIKEEIAQLLASTATQEQPESAEAFASGLASIIGKAIRSAQVVIPPSGIIVITTPSGGPATNANPGAGYLQ